LVTEQLVKSALVIVLPFIVSLLSVELAMLLLVRVLLVIEIGDVSVTPVSVVVPNNDKEVEDASVGA
jgi:hypothetical protein